MSGLRMVKGRKPDHIAARVLICAANGAVDWVSAGKTVLTSLRVKGSLRGERAVVCILPESIVLMT